MADRTGDVVIPSTHRAAILVVDDEPTNLGVISTVLQSDGYSVVEATGGQQAVEIWKNHGGFDLLVADVLLSDDSGIHAAAQILQSASRTVARALFVSGTPMTGWSSSDLDTFHALPLNRVDFLEKPFHAKQLVECVRNLLSSGQQADALWAELNAAKRAYWDAAAASRATISSFKDLGFGHPDGNLARRQAARVEAEALARYKGAVRRVREMLES